MPTDDQPPAKERVVVWAPVGRTAELIVEALERRGSTVERSSSLDTLPEAVVESVHAIVLLPEALRTADELERLHQILAVQPIWSNLPVIACVDGLTSLTTKLGRRLASLPGLRIVKRPLSRAHFDDAVEDALRRRRRQLEVRDTLVASRRLGEAHRARAEQLEKFSRALAHDIRTPLQSLATAFALLEAEREASPRLKRTVTRARRTARELERMTTDLLAYAHLSAEGDDPNTLEPLPLEPLVENVLTLLQYRIEERDAEVTVGELPIILGKDALIRQVFQNLIINALKYNDADRPTIAIWSDSSPDEYVVHCRDNGRGVPVEDRERIFEMYERGSADMPGSGIGLALCREAMQRHGGRITLNPSDEGGSTFSLWFPREGT